MRVCVRAALQSISSFLPPFLRRSTDRVAFVRFNTRSTVAFPLQTKSAGMRRVVEDSITPTGGTAFFDAVQDCVDLVQVCLLPPTSTPPVFILVRRLCVCAWCVWSDAWWIGMFVCCVCLCLLCLVC